jgi:hypothetical protein
MIKYDPEKDEIQVVETLSFKGTVLPLIKEAKEHYGERYEEEDLPEGCEAEDVENFLNWDPETGKTPLYEADRADLMQQLADAMNEAEWESGFNVEYSIRQALAEWITEEFGFECDPYTAFSDFE